MFINFDIVTRLERTVILKQMYGFDFLILLVTYLFVVSQAGNTMVYCLLTLLINSCFDTLLRFLHYVSHPYILRGYRLIYFLRYFTK